MEFDINKIRALCDRYFDGDTTAEDEQMLREYFSSAQDVPADLKAVKVIIPILIPLFSSSIRHALDLATAMECRCYRGGEGRTRMKILKCRASDILALVAVIAFGVAIVCINIFAAPYLPF